MSKLLKVIVNTLLLLAILSAGALVIPPFAGITTLVSDGMGNTNISRGAVTYAKKTETSTIASGDKILVDDNSGKYIYTVQSIDTANGTASVKNVISNDTTEITVRATVSKVLVTIPFIGFLSMAAQSKEGILIIGLAILFLIILFILSEVWKRDEEEDEDEEEEDEEEEDEEEEEGIEEVPDRKKKHGRKKAVSVETENQEEKDMTAQLAKMEQEGKNEEVEELPEVPEMAAEETENTDEFTVRDLEEESTEQVSFSTVDLQRLIRGEEASQKTESGVEETDTAETAEEDGEAAVADVEPEEVKAEEIAVEETVVTETTSERENSEKEAAENAELATDETFVSTDAAEPGENFEFSEERAEEPEEVPEEEPEESDEPISLAMPVCTAEELLEKAHAAGDDPEVIEDPATGITILDYSDIL